MYKRYNKRMFIFLVLSTVLFIVSIFYFNFQGDVLKKYNSLKEGEIILAEVAELDGHDYTNPDRPVFWRYTFSLNGQNYTCTTLKEYSPNTMQLMKNNLNQIAVKYILIDNEIALESQETFKINGIEYLMPVSCEAEYFNISRPPSLAAAIAILISGILCLIVVIINFLITRFYKNIEIKGYDAYAVFIEAYSSKFGTNRYMAVRYKYKNDQEQWIETVSPYAFHPINIEILKNVGAIKIRIKGKHSVIIENTQNIRQNRLT